MTGTIVSIDSDIGKVVKVLNINGSPTLHDLQTGIGGGHIQIVPYFTTIFFGGALRQCFAFCDEDGKGKGLPFNERATSAWQKCLQRQGKSLFDARGQLLDYLVGKIAIVWGDEAFMQEM